MGPLRLMEDHRDAYFLWKELGIRGASCLHIDAHLDMAQYQTFLDAGLVQPEVNCGNYLLKAVEEGIVSRVVWVVPPHLSRAHADLLDWCHYELPAWLPVHLDEHNSLQLRSGRVEGTLRDVPFTICLSTHLPELGPDWLLDLDIDYFIDEQDDVWETPFELQARLQGWPFLATSVAISVIGGYTPVARRYLGDLSALIFAGRLDEAQAWWERYQGLDSLQDANPDLQAAALVGRARGGGSDHRGPAWDEAARLDPRYRVEPFDVAALHWHRKQFERCLRWLERVQGPQVDYLSGFIAFQRKDYPLAIEHWSRLRSQADPADPTSSRHLLTWLGLAQRRAGRHSDALSSFQQATALGESPTDLLRELARTQRQLGDPTQAQRNYRRAVKAAPLELGNLEARLELAELYLETGQIMRAQNECFQLNALELPGNLALRNERLQVKIALKSGPPRRG